MNFLLHGLELGWGTVVYRPYVYAFLVCYLVFAVHHLGIKKAGMFLAGTYLIAFLAEYSSTRNGFPFGTYTYIEETRTRELWISNVPFWDSLSFVFLSYFSFIVAAAARFPRNLGRGFAALETPFIGGVLMMLLDIVIDPVALRGERWFLGRVYFYPNGGAYFGVTIANFVGWFVVGFFSQWIFQRFGFWRTKRPLAASFIWGAFGVYAGVFGFNLFMTAWIRAFPLFYASAAVVSITLAGLLFMITRSASELPNNTTEQEMAVSS
jgi:uncharacterized membrane protein